MITVYRFGTPAAVARQLPAALWGQLRLAHELREDLVTLEHSREARVRGVWSSYPHVGQVEAALVGAEQRASELADCVAEARRVQRTRAPKTPAVAELAAARAEVRRVKQVRRDAISAVRAQAGEQLAQMTTEYRRALKALYADYAQGSGLYWATFNDVVEQHKTAARRVAQIRAAGRPAQLRHHRWDGSGSYVRTHTGQPGNAAGQPGTGKPCPPNAYGCTDQSSKDVPTLWTHEYLRLLRSCVVTGWPCRFARDAAARAQAEATRLFGNPDPRGNNGATDAFVHAYWAALISAQFGEVTAREIARTYEYSPDNPYDQAHMAAANDFRGARAAQDFIQQHGKLVAVSLNDSRVQRPLPGTIGTLRVYEINPAELEDYIYQMAISGKLETLE